MEMPSEEIYVKEYGKKLKLEPKKLCHLKTTVIRPRIIGAVVMIKNGTDRNINKIHGRSVYERFLKNGTV